MAKYVYHNKFIAGEDDVAEEAAVDPVENEPESDDAAPKLAVIIVFFLINRISI